MTRSETEARVNYSNWPFTLFFFFFIFLCLVWFDYGLRLPE